MSPPTEPTAAMPPTIEQIVGGLELVLRLKPGSDTGQEHDDLVRLIALPAVARQVKGEPTDTEVIRVATLKALENLHSELTSSDQQVAEILFRVNTPVAERRAQIAKTTSGSSKDVLATTVNHLALHLMHRPKWVLATEAVGWVKGRKGILTGVLAVCTVLGGLTALGVPTQIFDGRLSTTVADVTSDEPGSPEISDETSPPDDADIPSGDLYLRLRPNNSLGEPLQPGQTLVVELEVARDGWLVLDLQCAGEIGFYPEHDGPLIVTGHTGQVYWSPPNPVTDCNVDLVQGPVASGTTYYYTVQLSDEALVGSRVGMVARFIQPPTVNSWDGKIVLPQTERKQTDSINNTLSAGTVHAYTHFVTTSDRLFFGFNCNDASSPADTPMRIRGLDMSGEEYFSQEFDDCVPWRAPAPPTDGRYEIQITAVDPLVSVFYRLAALFGN